MYQFYTPPSGDSKIYQTFHARHLFPELIQTPESELELINKDINHFINEAIDQLPPRCKEIFILSRIEHKSHQEIARQLNLSTKTIENQLTIALARLRKELEWFTRSHSFL
ncbi:MAG: sigma-70 family RNA polymerase sigma factor [Butyricimonas paravirosa]